MLARGRARTPGALGAELGSATPRGTLTAPQIRAAADADRRGVLALAIPRRWFRLPTARRGRGRSRTSRARRRRARADVVGRHDTSTTTDRVRVIQAADLRGFHRAGARAVRRQRRRAHRSYGEAHPLCAALAACPLPALDHRRAGPRRASRPSSRGGHRCAARLNGHVRGARAAGVARPVGLRAPCSRARASAVVTSRPTRRPPAAAMPSGPGCISWCARGRSRGPRSRGTPGAASWDASRRVDGDDRAPRALRARRSAAPVAAPCCSGSACDPPARWTRDARSRRARGRPRRGDGAHPRCDVVVPDPPGVVQRFRCASTRGRGAPACASSLSRVAWGARRRVVGHQRVHDARRPARRCRCGRGVRGARHRGAMIPHSACAITSRS